MNKNRTTNDELFNEMLSVQNELITFKYMVGVAFIINFVLLINLIMELT